MKIIKNTGSILVIQQDPTKERLIFGLILMCMAGATATSVPSGDEQPISTSVSTALLGLFFLIKIGFTQKTIWTFDRELQEFTILSKGLLWRKSLSYQLSKISQVRVDRRETESGSVFTVVVTLAQGTSVDLSPSYGLSEINAKDGKYHISTFLRI
jgi:hypothetical protein